MPKAKTADIEIYYEQHGRGSPLLMILGLGQDVATWHFQISEFSRHFRVVVFDNRDSGKSSRMNTSYSTEDMAHDVLGLLDHLEIQSTHVLGTSMGGMMAQHLALIAPERISSLVLSSTTSYGRG